MLGKRTVFEKLSFQTIRCTEAQAQRSAEMFARGGGSEVVLGTDADAENSLSVLFVVAVRLVVLARGKDAVQACSPDGSSAYPGIV